MIELVIEVVFKIEMHCVLYIHRQTKEQNLLVIF